MNISDTSLRSELPRLYELKDAGIDPSDPNEYFHRLEERCAEHRTVFGIYKRLERGLCALDDAALADFRSRAVAQAAKRHPIRGWRELFDVFSEAKGFTYLRSIGCTNVRFVPRASSRTPDLEGLRNAKLVLCEVKTLNVSQDEATKRDRVHRGEIIGGEVADSLGAGFLNKLSSDIENASQQLQEHDPGHLADWMIFTVVNFDDWVGDYQRKYFDQIDRYLRSNPVSEVEFVFCHASNLFERTFTMTAATVFHG